MRVRGRGVIAAKLYCNGDFTNPEDCEKAVQHAVLCGFVDAKVIGFKGDAEIDNAIE